MVDFDPDNWLRSSSSLKETALPVSAVPLLVIFYKKLKKKKRLESREWINIEQE